MASSRTVARRRRQPAARLSRVETGGRRGQPRDQKQPVVGGDDDQQADQCDLDQQDLAVARLEEVGHRADLGDGQHGSRHQHQGNRDPGHGREPLDQPDGAGENTVIVISVTGARRPRRPLQHRGDSSLRRRRSAGDRHIGDDGDRIGSTHLSRPACRPDPVVHHHHQADESAEPHGGKDGMDHIGRRRQPAFGRDKGVAEGHETTGGDQQTVEGRGLAGGLIPQSQ